MAAAWPRDTRGPELRTRHIPRPSCGFLICYMVSAVTSRNIFTSRRELFNLLTCSAISIPISAFAITNLETRRHAVSVTPRSSLCYTHGSTRDGGTRHTPTTTVRTALCWLLKRTSQSRQQTWNMDMEFNGGACAQGTECAPSNRNLNMTLDTAENLYLVCKPLLPLCK